LEKLERAESGKWLMRNQSCLAVVLGGRQHCRVLARREIALEVVNYDVYLACPAWHHSAAFAFRVPEGWDEGMIYAQD
jgi:hypothetical protein